MTEDERVNDAIARFRVIVDFSSSDVRRMFFTGLVRAARQDAIEEEREGCAVDAYDEYLRARELQARRGDYGGDLFRAGITQGRAQAASMIAARIRARKQQETKDDSKDF